MNTRKVLSGIVVAVCVIGALSVSACHRYRSPSERADWMAEKVAKELKLDDQQKIKLEAVKQEFLAARAEMQRQHAAMLDDVMAQIQTDQLDQAKLLQMLEQHHELETDLAPKVLAKVAELHATLSSEQKAQAVEHLQRFRDRMQRDDKTAKM